MTNQKDTKQVRMDSWLLKLLSRDKKIRKTKMNQQTIIKNNKKLKNNKIKAIRYIAPNMDHYPSN